MSNVNVLCRQLTRALVAAQVAVLDYPEVDIEDHEARTDSINDLKTCMKEANKLVRKLEKLEKT